MRILNLGVLFSYELIVLWCCHWAKSADDACL